MGQILSGRSEQQQQQAATLPSFSEVVRQLSSIFTRENLIQAGNKIVNLYLPVVFTYISYRAPFLAQIGNYIAASSFFQTVRKAITDRINNCCANNKPDGTPAAITGSDNAGARKKDDDLISTGKNVIDAIVDNTIAGQVYKKLTGQSRSKTIELGSKQTGEGSKPTNESGTPPSTPSPTSGEAEGSSSASSEGRKVIFPSDSLSLPSPAITVRLEDRGPAGWKEAVNQKSSTTPL